MRRVRPAGFVQGKKNSVLGFQFSSMQNFVNGCAANQQIFFANVGGFDAPAIILVLVTCVTNHLVNITFAMRRKRFGDSRTPPAEFPMLVAPVRALGPGRT